MSRFCASACSSWDLVGLPSIIVIINHHHAVYYVDLSLSR